MTAHAHRWIARGTWWPLAAVGLAVWLGGGTGGGRAVAGPRERKIKALEHELARLEQTAYRALRFRARYLNLRADIYFMERLNRQDEQLLDRLIAYLKTPVSLYDAFLSSETSSFDAAKRKRGRYAPGRVTLWLKCRFGLGQVRQRSTYSVQVDVVDSVQGRRLYQRLGPWKRRAARIITQMSVPITGLRLAPGRYQLRVRVRIAGKVATKLIPYVHGRRLQGPRRLPPPPRGDVHTLGNF